MCNTELSFDSCRSLAYAAITIGLSIKSQPPFSGFHGVKRPCPDIDILPESGINGNLNFIYQKKMRFSGKDTLPMRAVDIGITWFPNPSPKLNANTAVCLVMPTISATGVKDRHYYSCQTGTGCDDRIQSKVDPVHADTPKKRRKCLQNQCTSIYDSIQNIRGRQNTGSSSGESQNNGGNRQLFTSVRKVIGNP